MKKNNTVYALIFAGGIGRRMSESDIPKQFLEVDGKSIIIRTLEHFTYHEMVDKIVVVCLESWIEYLQADIARYRLPKIEKIIPGGDTGFQSIHLGLKVISAEASGEDIVLICDGVRPMLSESLLTNCINFSEEYGTAVPVTPSIDSILYSKDSKVSKTNYDRNSIFLTQAPQGFKLSIINEAHRIATDNNMEAISSADLMIELGREVHIYQGIRENIKVTTPEDLNSLRAIYYYEHFKHFAKEEMQND